MIKISFVCNVLVAQYEEFQYNRTETIVNIIATKYSMKYKEKTYKRTRIMMSKIVSEILKAPINTEQFICRNVTTQQIILDKLNALLMSIELGG